jgi:tetratricopeptide (TPR) repeat protein
MYEQSLKIDQELGDKRNQGITLDNVAEVLYFQGKLSDSRKTHEQALQIDIESGDLYAQAEALFGIGQVLAAQGDLAGAREKQQAVLKIGEPALVAAARVALAQLSLEEGHPADAEGPSTQAAEDFQKEGLTDQEGLAWNVLARSLLAQNKLPEAAKAILEAKAITAKSKDPRLQLTVAITAARIEAASGSQAQDSAISNLHGIIDEAIRNRFTALQFEATLALAEIELKTKRSSEARIQLARLEKQAKAQGFGLIARKAAAASGKAQGSRPT